MARNKLSGIANQFFQLDRGNSHERADAEVVELSDASVGAVDAEKATISRSLVQSVSARDDVTMTLSGALSVRADGDVAINGGVAPVVTAGRDMRMRGATTVLALTPKLRVESGTVGVLLAGSAEIDKDARVLFTARDALLLGGLLGVLLPLIAYLLRRFAPPPEEKEPRPWYTRLGFWLLRQLITIGATALLGWLAYRNVRGKIAEHFPQLLER